MRKLQFLNSYNKIISSRNDTTNRKNNNKRSGFSSSNINKSDSSNSNSNINTENINFTESSIIKRKETIANANRFHNNNIIKTENIRRINNSNSDKFSSDSSLNFTNFNYNNKNNIKNNKNLLSSDQKLNFINSTVKQNKTNTIRTKSTIGRKHKFNNSTALRGSNYQEQEYAVSIIENYSREVGISAFNFRTMELFITQFIDNEAYVNSISMINLWRPLEVIINQKSENSCLHLLIKKIFKNCYVQLIPRKNFQEDIGREIYLQSGTRELTAEDLNTKYVCMASLSGLITYLDQNSNINIEKEHLNIKFHYIENHLNISFQSTIDLELLFNSKYNKSFGSLLSLFKCQTVSGMRLLRSNILQPPAVKNDINRRYESIEELINNPEVLFHIKEFLPLFKDLELNISKFIHKIEEPTETVIKQILSSIHGIRLSLKHLINFREVIKHKLKSYLFNIISNSFEDKIFEYLLDNIENLIEDFDFTNTKIIRKQDSIFFMIKAGFNNLLDVSRKTYSDTVNEIHSEFEKLKINTNDPNIKLLFSEGSGYYIVINERFYVESDYVVMRKVNKKIHCANIPLVSLSERIKEIKRDLVDISMSLIIDLVKVIQKNISYLYVMSSYIAQIDVICAFTDYSMGSIYMKMSKPIINKDKNYPFIMGKNCRHPLYEKSVILNNSEDLNNYFVPNDYFLTNHFNILLLKGANASGKTTYMKGLALITILAQIGCFVPCDHFEFTLRKFLYTKFDSNDNVEENRGAFVKEIIEIQKVVSNHMNESLVLLDEPFDNSDSKENLAISIAILDQFTNLFTCSFIIISSHNNSLSKLSNFYFNIMIGTMVVEFTDEAMNFLFKFKFNNLINNENNSNNYVYSNEENYGIILANMIGFNKDIIDKAKEISNLSIRQNNQIGDFIEQSDYITYFKAFLFILLYELYDFKCITHCYITEEEILIKKREISQFIKNALN